jgi:hypothetical protein
VAFDRCFLPLAALFLLSGASEAIVYRNHAVHKVPTEEKLAAKLPVAPSEWEVWLPFALGLVLVVLWLRALLGLLGTWSDPSFRVLRFSASVLLVPFALVACHLLRLPFS